MATLCIAGASPGYSRPWKPTATALAQDYAQIQDNRGKGGLVDLVLVLWLAPEMFQDNPQAHELLDKYVVIGLVHAKSEIGGIISFEEIETPQAEDGNSKPLALLTGDKIPPAIAGMMVALEGSLRQALGLAGQGINWFAFDGGAVHSCEKGRLSIPFAGETYTYETPIPGCPQK